MLAALWPVGPVSLLPVEILWRRAGLKSQLRQRSRLNPTGASFQSRFLAARDGNNESIGLKRSGEDQGAESAYETAWHPVNTSLGCPAPPPGGGTAALVVPRSHPPRTVRWLGCRPPSRALGRSHRGGVHLSFSWQEGVVVQIGFRLYPL